MLHSEPLSEKAKTFPGLNHKGIEGTVLATIINRKVEDVETLSVSGERKADRRSLYEALKKGEGRHFILECKQSSPTLGDFCRDFDLDKLIACYEQHASAISVLCEEHFFKGSLEYLKYVRSHTTLPVICKDFVICEKQLEAAAVAGADAVLLMLSVLSEPLFETLYKKAQDLGLEVLCEVDNKEQAEYAVKLNLPIVGINNRDLRVLKIDLNNARNLFPLFPATTAVVSESGINTHRDLVSLNPVKNFLIGSALTGFDNLCLKANSMLYGLNKLCGLKTGEGVEAAIRNHAAIAGLIFCKKSPRNLTLDEAKKLVALGRGRISFAGVFVNEGIDVMVQCANILNLDFIQLHGTEAPEIIDALHERLPGIRVIKAVAISDLESFRAVRPYQGKADYILLDSKSPGSGKSFCWGQTPAYIDIEHTLLSGGIGPDNVKEALLQGFAGLGLNAKLERAPGVKDPDLVGEVFALINRF